jgi:hypothetical protein
MKLILCLEELHVISARRSASSGGDATRSGRTPHAHTSAVNMLMMIPMLRWCET